MTDKGRLTRPREYAQVYRQDNPLVSSLMVMRWMPNGLALSRYGFTISKKVGGAVVRNRIRRRLGEILRPVSLCPGWDIVFIMRQAAALASFAELKKNAEGILARAHLLERKDEETCLKAN